MLSRCPWHPTLWGNIMRIQATLKPTMGTIAQPAFAGRKLNTRTIKHVGQTSAVVGGILFGVGYFQNELGASASGTFITVGGLGLWGIAKAIEKTREAIASVKRRFAH